MRATHVPILLYVTLLLNTAYGQNIVTNGSFDVSLVNQMNYQGILGYNGFDANMANLLPGWSRPTDGTSDYFNFNDARLYSVYPLTRGLETYNLGVARNYVNIDAPGRPNSTLVNGGYIGIWHYRTYRSGVLNVNYFEYATNTLTVPTQAGVYKFRMKIGVPNNAVPNMDTPDRTQWLQHNPVNQLALILTVNKPNQKAIPSYFGPLNIANSLDRVFILKRDDETSYFEQPNGLLWLSYERTIEIEQGGHNYLTLGFNANAVANGTTTTSDTQFKINRHLNKVNRFIYYNIDDVEFEKTSEEGCSAIGEVEVVSKILSSTTGKCCFALNISALRGQKVQEIRVFDGSSVVHSTQYSPAETGSVTTGQICMDPFKSKMLTIEIYLENGLVCNKSIEVSCICDCSNFDITGVRKSVTNLDCTFDINIRSAATGCIPAISSVEHTSSPAGIQYISYGTLLPVVTQIPGGRKLSGIGSTSAIVPSTNTKLFEAVSFGSIDNTVKITLPDGTTCMRYFHAQCSNPNCCEAINVRLVARPRESFYAGYLCSSECTYDVEYRVDPSNPGFAACSSAGYIFDIAGTYKPGTYDNLTFQTRYYSIGPSIPQGTSGEVVAAPTTEWRTLTRICADGQPTVRIAITSANATCMKEVAVGNDCTSSMEKKYSSDTVNDEVMIEDVLTTEYFDLLGRKLNNVDMSGCVLEVVKSLDPQIQPRVRIIWK